jgi:trehalose 6-phosphate synthase/phosphatase
MQFPIGIDPDRFIQALETDQVKSHIKELRRFFAGRKVPLFLFNYYLSKFHI